MTNLPIKIVCDPTLLLTKRDYLNFIKPKPEKNRYIFLYAEGNNRNYEIVITVIYLGSIPASYANPLEIMDYQ